jgi:hypothetical protein
LQIGTLNESSIKYQSVNFSLSLFFIVYFFLHRSGAIPIGRLPDQRVSIHHEIAWRYIPSFGATFCGRICLFASIAGHNVFVE